MTDYLAGLNRARQNYIDSRTGKDTGVSLVTGGLGAPTPKKVVKEVAEKTDNVNAKALNRVYESDDADYAGSSYKYQLQAGDTLSELALKHGMSVPEILRLNKDNPAIKTKDLIYAGGTINLSIPEGYKVPAPMTKTETYNIDKIIKGLSEKYKLPYEFVKAIGTQESGLKYAEGALDEKGIMQVRPIALEDINKHYEEFKGNPITMEQLTKGSNSYNIDRSVEAGVAYLAMLRDKYKAKSLKEIATMYNGGPNAVRSGNKKANAYANSVMNIMKGVQPFKDAPPSLMSEVKEEVLPEGFNDINYDGWRVNLGELMKTQPLENEFEKLSKDLLKLKENSIDVTTKLKLGKKLMEESYEIINGMGNKDFYNPFHYTHVPPINNEITFEERVKKSFPKDSSFVEKILENKTEEQKQSIVARPKRFVR